MVRKNSLATISTINVQLPKHFRQLSTVACWKALYGIPDVLPKATKGNSLGLFEQGDYFAESDIDLYMAEFASYVPEGTYPISAVIDGADYSEPSNNTDLVGGEANIDIDIA